MNPQQVIVFIIGTIVILFGAYYVTYYVGMKASGQTRAGFRNKNISLLDRYAIARDKQFCIIEVAGKVYLVGLTNHTMTLLDTFDAAAFAKLTEDNDVQTPWNMTPVGQYGNKLTRKVVEFIAVKTGKVKKEDIKKGDADFAESFKEAQRTSNSDEESEKRDTGEKNTSGEKSNIGEINIIGEINDIGETNNSMQPDETNADPPEAQEEN